MGGGEEGERETERDRQRQRETETERDRHRDRQTDRDRERQVQRETGTERDRERQRERVRQRQTETGTERETDRQTETERDRQRETQRERQRDRDKETETDRQRQRQTETKRQSERGGGGGEAVKDRQTDRNGRGVVGRGRPEVREGATKRTGWTRNRLVSQVFFSPSRQYPAVHVISPRAAALLSRCAREAPTEKLTSVIDSCGSIASSISRHPPRAARVSDV